MLVQRENVQLTINADDLQKYLSQGYVEVKIESKEKKTSKEKEEK